MGVRAMESLYLKPVTCEEINNILVSLKDTACGWDNISAVVLRLSSQFIVQPYTFVYMQPISDWWYISWSVKADQCYPFVQGWRPYII